MTVIIQCETCNKELTEGYNPVNDKFYCPDCFWKKVNKYLKKTSVKELTLSDLRAIFDKVEKTEQLKVI